ncbi:hypothetical protein SAMN05444340_11172 [Citreimonas salinaria]|uniref:Uncharacterized protein n=1 Tax=Citreimonas salinaria TaxID=321339 RepID=A0A1H3L583_9RHOB|nr:hypothetical protein SAMN05444340_11172 [Citreimonas salinaria]
MKHIAFATLLALGATAGHADVGPAFLPDLTFPAPVPAPPVSIQDCETAPRCTR